MNSIKYTIDRFEGDYAVLLQRDDETIEKIISREELGDSFVEGDILLLTFDNEGKLIKVKFLKEETAKARKRVNDLLNKLKNK
ncbi:DUF3006 domain-containing protein [Aeribacillus pallidus]|uniref:DUF3006 domain-containing protein n=1 Tax=Aeribacillus pallidus TaxID=33936 RepID=UPI003D192CA1